MGLTLDLTGKKFGRWTVLERSGRRGSNAMWKCRCDCGTVRDVRATALVNGKSCSCGCKRIDVITKHGKTNSKLFNVWRTMKERCRNKTYFQYKDYGGRGISLCDEWLEYLPFEKWALANGYKEGLSIDRIDVNGDYCPENCRWSTPKEQTRNRRNTIYLEHEGEKKSLADWADALGVKYNRLYYRLSAGWSVKDVLYGK